MRDTILPKSVAALQNLPTWECPHCLSPITRLKPAIYSHLRHHVRRKEITEDQAMAAKNEAFPGMPKNDERA